MLCAVIKGPSIELAAEQIEKAAYVADILEFRLDLFETIDEQAIRGLKEKSSLPAIFTLRKQSQGGAWQGSEESRLHCLKILAELHPQYIDLEYDAPAEFVSQLENAGQSLIISYHNFLETPKNLENIFLGLPRIKNGYYKVATMARSISDAFSILHLAKKHSGNTLAMGMGTYGPLTRILGPVVGNAFTYCPLEVDPDNPLGQVSASELIHKYNHRSLNQDTKVFCLLGQPVTKSISDFTHNRIFFQQKWNSVYVKIDMPPCDLPQFFEGLEKFPLSGMSVTHPLKEIIIPFIDEIDTTAQKIGAVNTIVWENGGCKGYNTDACGALQAIEQTGPVRNKRMIILGTGGAAKSIGYEAYRRGASLIYLSRNPKKAAELAASCQQEYGSQEQMEGFFGQGYDYLINCTPAEMPISPQFIHPKCIAMDLTVKPMETPFLAAAKQKGCSLIYGYEMFANQAVEQFKLWFGCRNAEEIREELLMLSKQYLGFTTKETETALGTSSRSIYS